MNPYLIDEPCAISFSGGRTSGFMLKQIIDAHGGSLPDYCVVTFGNTGKEMPQTLDFVKECGEQWGVDIVWLELECKRNPEGAKRKYENITHVVDYQSAARNGEPFSSLIQAKQYLPNPVARFCTQELKILRIRDYMNSIHDDWVNVVGLRADETRRTAKLRGRSDVLMPIADAGHSVIDVSNFWAKQDFDLNLPNDNGKTAWGNCDMCFLKGYGIKSSIARERPDLCDWWAEQEAIIGGTFRSDQPDYLTMKNGELAQDDFFYDDAIDCFCTD